MIPVFKAQSVQLGHDWQVDVGIRMNQHVVWNNTFSVFPDLMNRKQFLMDSF